MARKRNTIDTSVRKNIPLLLRSRMVSCPEITLQAAKDRNGVFQMYSYKQVYKKVVEMACALKKIGIQRGDKIALISDNRREWLVADMALLSLGAADVPRGCDSMGTEIRFIISFVECKIGFFETGWQLSKVLEKKEEIPTLKTAILFEKATEEVLQTAKNAGITVIAYTELEKMGETASEAERAVVEHEMDITEADEVATIIFTSGTTGAVNLVAFSFGEAFVNEGDEIIITEAEHHSNIVPWQMMCQRKGASLKVLPVDESGHLMLENLDDIISDRTRIMAVTHVSNVIGLINPVKEIIGKCHAKGVKVLVDGAQGAVHCNVDVRDLDCDFYAFSGHKLYAATGTGVLYGKKELLEAMPPYMGGGEMVGTVRFSGTTYAPLPMKFEAGTQNFASAATLKPAVEFVRSLNDKDLIDYYDNIRDYILNKLLSDERITLYGVPRGTAQEKIPLFSFTVKGIHHEDIALILDKMGVAVRSGQMCAEPLMDRFGVTGMLRVSFAPYNTMEEAEYFVKCLNKAIDMLS